MTRGGAQMLGEAADQLQPMPALGRRRLELYHTAARKRELLHTRVGEKFLRMIQGMNSFYLNLREREGGF